MQFTSQITREISTQSGGWKSFNIFIYYRQNNQQVGMNENLKTLQKGKHAEKKTAQATSASFANLQCLSLYLSSCKLFGTVNTHFLVVNISVVELFFNFKNTLLYSLLLDSVCSRLSLSKVVSYPSLRSTILVIRCGFL